MKFIGMKFLSTALVVLVLMTACTRSSPEQQIESAKDYLKKNDSKAASIQIKNALQAEPNLAEARFLLGTILLKDGDAGAAEIELRKARAASYPDEIVVPVLVRAMLLSGGQDKKIVDEFGQSKFDKPISNASLQTSLSVAYSNLNRPQQAKDALSAAIAADPTYAPAALADARVKAQMQDFAGALSTIEAVIAKDGSNPEAWKLKGDVLFSRNDVDGAIAAYRKSLEAGPRYGPSHFALLELLMRKADLAGATAELEQIKKVAAKSAQVEYFDAMLAYQKKDFKTARSMVKNLLTATPNNPLVLQLAGAVELELNALPSAEGYLTRALKAAPKLAFARRLIITTYLRSRQPAKALESLKDGVGSEGIDPATMALAAEVYLLNGDVKKANEYYTLALKRDPDSAKLRTGLALTHLAGGETESAFAELQRIAASDSDTTADMAIITASLSRKDWDRASAAIDKLEIKQPKKPIAAQLRGELQLSQKKLPEAQRSFQQALSIDPDSFTATASLAAIDSAEGKPADAKARFEAFLARNPKNTNALLALTELAAARHADTSEIVGLLKRGIDADPDDVRPRIALAELYLRGKDVKLATSTAQNAAAALPDNPDVVDLVGRVQLAAGETNQALATFDKLASLQPTSPQAQMRLATAQMAAKNPKDARDSVLKALHLQPDFLDAQRALIVLALDDKRPQDALEIARTIQRQRPAAAAGYVLEGEIAAVQKNWDAAAAGYRAALQHGPDTEIAVKLHSTLLAMGSPEAAKFGAGWMKDHPKDSAFLMYLGQAAIARKDYAAAEKAHLSVVQMQPDNAVAFNNLAWVMGQLGREGAVAYAEKAVALAPNQPAFMDTLAMLLADNENYAKAIEVQTRALELQPTSTSLRMNLAKIYLKAGNRDKAKSELQTLVKLGDKVPNQSEVSELLRTL